MKPDCWVVHRSKNYYYYRYHSNTPGKLQKIASKDLKMARVNLLTATAFLLALTVLATDSISGDEYIDTPTRVKLCPTQPADEKCPKPSTTTIDPSVFYPPWGNNENAPFIPMVYSGTNDDMRGGRTTDDITYFLDNPANWPTTDIKCALEFFALCKGVNTDAAKGSKSFNFDWPQDCSPNYNKPTLDDGIKAFAELRGTTYFTAVLFCLPVKAGEPALVCPSGDYRK